MVEVALLLSGAVLRAPRHVRQTVREGTDGLVEENVARRTKKKQDRIDPEWPEGDHAVSEFLSESQGSLSPFGSVSFPLDEGKLPYVHPETKINK